MREGLEEITRDEFEAHLEESIAQAQSLLNRTINTYNTYLMHSEHYSLRFLLDKKDGVAYYEKHPKRKIGFDQGDIK